MPTNPVIVQVIGAEKVQAALTLAQRKVKLTTVNLTREAGQICLAAIKSYPASKYTDDWKNRVYTFFPFKPPQTKKSYERTGTMQNSWKGGIRRDSSGGGPRGGGVVSYGIYQQNLINPKSGKNRKGKSVLEYTKYVIGDEQVKQHKGYWRKITRWEGMLEKYILKVYKQSFNIDFST
jgi:hypothetical protein